ncbi:hypothetical protein ACR777_10390 [Sphingobacterium spiritivorum]|uniref:hypothetical protein n=1 Tax=Sphingobacterium spiritivorum TaxID=258 RepID=UPI003DA28973
MKTLIFKTVKDLKSRFGNSEKIEYVKEGDFYDAMSFFDDQYPLFFSEKGDENFDSSIDEEGYIKDSSGDVRFTFSELKGSDCHTFNVDGGYFRNYYTTKSNDLTDDELLAVANDYNAEDYFVENGFSKLHFRLAEYFDDFQKLIEYADNYIEEFQVHTEEPEEDFYIFEDKYYTKF